MLKISLKGFTLILGVIFIIGCASTKDVKMRGYVEVKDRVDQNMEAGNAGYLSGTPVPEDRTNIRKTRKTYVLEVSKADRADEETVIIEDSAGYDDAAANDEFLEPEYMIEVSKESALKYEEDVYSDEIDEPAPVASSTQYTVQKDDTLQKISKKFYDSFSKWPKIYDANRGVIDNPDRIKPGIVIQIPSL